MYSRLFQEFVTSGDNIRVYRRNRLIFHSTGDRLIPLLEYIDHYQPCQQPVVIYDRVVGNAAALLCILAGSREVYSPVGSQLATRTLDQYGVNNHFNRIVPYIQQAGGGGICPMERLSIHKTPEEFYRAVKDVIEMQVPDN